MPGLAPGIHVLLRKKHVDGRGKPGHDGKRMLNHRRDSHLSTAPLRGVLRARMVLAP
jgi:hypothetical protein